MGGWDAIPSASQQPPPKGGWDAIPEAAPKTTQKSIQVPVASHEPSPFPIDDYINQQVKDLPPEQESNSRSDWTSVLSKVAQPWQAVGYSAASSLNRGMAHFASSMDEFRKWMETTEGPLTKVPGFKPSGDESIFENLAKGYEANADYWKQRADQVGVSFMEELVGNAVGGAPPGVTEFMLDVESGLTIPALVAQQKSEERGGRGAGPMLDGLVEAAKVGTLQGLFRSVAPFKQYIQAAALGTYFGAESAYEAPKGQKSTAFAQGAGTGMLLGAAGQPGDVGIRDLYPEMDRTKPPKPVALPVEPMREPLRPAIRMGDKVTAGEPGETHSDILSKTEPKGESVELPPPERGFVDTEGNFLTREEAEKSVEQNEPEVHEAWKQIAGEDAPFHSEDYNRARETVQAGHRPLPLGSASALLVDNPPTYKPRVEPTGIWGAIGNVFHNMYNATTIDIIPNLHDAGVDNNGVQHANAKTAAPKIVNDFLARVFPEDYKNPKKMAPFIDILNKDNILGGYDSFLKSAEEARVDGDDAAARKWDRLADAVKAKHDLDAYDTEVQKAKGNKKFMETNQRWQDHVVPKLDQLYNEMKQQDPYTQRDSRGRYLDSRINLLSEEHAARWMESMADDDKPMPETSASSYRNPNVKRDPTDFMAKFTSNYSTDARAVLMSVVGPRWNEVTKLRFYNDLIENGVGVPADETYVPKPRANETPQQAIARLKAQIKKIDTSDYALMPFRIPKTNSKGVTKMEEAPILVPKNLVREIRGVLGTDMRLKENAVGRVLTGVQLTQLADLTTHAKNITSVVTRAQGAGDVWTDAVRKVPGLGSADALWRLAKTTREVIQDTPEIRAEIEQMARRGLVRPEFPSTGIQKITRGQEILHAADTSARIIMNRFFDNLVDRKLAADTEENRRAFVNQVGEYNSRLQGPIMAKAKESGLSPFVVAGRNFNRQGRWAITGNPGLEAASMGAAVQMRVTNLLGTAALFTVPMLLNYLTTGKMTGRSGTPLGAWDLGHEPDENGKHKAIDLLNWTGARRGMRSIGLDAFAQGLMNGDHLNDIIGNALQDAGNTIIHPWNGPAIAFAEKTATGKQLDLRGKMEAEKVPEGGGLQYLENFRAALESQNALVYSIVRPAFQELGLDQKIQPEGYAKSVGKTLLKSPGQAIGMRDITPPPTDTERLKRDMEIKRERMKKDLERETGIDRAAQKKRFTLLKRRAMEE